MHNSEKFRFNKNDRLILYARYNEDINHALSLVPSGFKCLIYNKGGDDLSSHLSDSVQIINIPNEGREAESYLRFIIDYYDEFPDQVVFSQAEPMFHYYRVINETPHDMIRIDRPDGVHNPDEENRVVMLTKKEILDRVSNSFNKKESVSLSRQRIWNLKYAVFDCDFFLINFIQDNFVGDPLGVIFPFCDGACFKVIKEDIHFYTKEYWQFLYNIQEEQPGDVFATAMEKFWFCSLKRIFIPINPEFINE